MQFISETQIDAIAEQFAESKSFFEQCILDLEAQQPTVVAYLFSDNMRVLRQSEKEYMLYILTVIWQTLHKQGLSIPILNEQHLANAEENNWTLVQGVKAKRFRDRLDVFFEDYFQEDLLAFIEDSLAEEEDEGILTKEGREPIFVTLKSILDGWTQS